MRWFGQWVRKIKSAAYQPIPWIPWRKGITRLAGLIIGIVVVMMVAIVGTLVGGIFTQKTQDIFTANNVSQDWVNIANQASSYSQTGLSLLMVGIIVAAAMAVIAVITAYFRWQA